MKKTLILIVTDIDQSCTFLLVQLAQYPHFSSLFKKNLLGLTKKTFENFTKSIQELTKRENQTINFITHTKKLFKSILILETNHIVTVRSILKIS